MRRHPFERLTPNALRVAAGAAVGAWIVLTALAAAVVSVEDTIRIAELASARSAAQARELLHAWPEAAFRSAAFLLGFDFLYDVVHNNAVALAALWGVSVRGGRGLLAARSWAWALWLCTLLNLPENLIFLRVIGGTPSDPWVGIASSIAVLRFLVLWSGALFAVVSVAWAWRDRRRADAATRSVP